MRTGHLLHRTGCSDPIPFRVAVGSPSDCFQECCLLPGSQLLTGVGSLVSRAASSERPQGPRMRLRAPAAPLPRGGWKQRFAMSSANVWVCQWGCISCERRCPLYPKGQSHSASWLWGACGSAQPVGAGAIWAAGQGPSCMVRPPCMGTERHHPRSFLPLRAGGTGHGEQREGPGLAVALETGWWGASSPSLTGPSICSGFSPPSLLLFVPLKQTLKTFPYL